MSLQSKINTVNKLIKSKGITTVSFDFFDTLFLRRCPTPADLFLMLGGRLHRGGHLDRSVSIWRFQELRIRAEHLARTRGSIEISISDIYKEFPSDFFSCPKETIIEAEILEEKLNIFAFNQGLMLLKEAKKNNKKIIVVSDTYFSGDQLRGLADEFIGQETVDFYTSSDHQTGKSQELFTRVAASRKILPTSILHFGDNYVSDYEVPIQRGLKAAHVPHGDSTFWNIYEQEMQICKEESRAGGQYGDLGITSLRAKSIACLDENEIDATSYYRYGVTLLGPVLSVFVNWVWLTAKNKRVELILPVMREGYLITELLKQIAELDTPEPLTIRPIFLSRRLLVRTSIYEVDRKSLENIRFTNLGMSVSNFIELVGLDMSEVKDTADFINGTISDDTVFDRVVKTLIDSEFLKEKIKYRARQERRGLISYLKKIFGDAKHATLVDVGWNGTIQRMLQEIIEQEGLAIKIEGLYMMTTPKVNESLFDRVLTKGFFVDAGRPEADFDQLQRTLEILEQSCSPSHGSVSHYDRRTGSPILSRDLIPVNQRLEIDEIQEGIKFFHSIYLEHVFSTATLSSLERIKPVVTTILRRSMMAPSKEEANLFKDWEHDDNLGTGGTTSIFGDYRLQLFLKYMTQTQFGSIPARDLPWPSASLVVNEPEMGIFLTKFFLKNNVRIGSDHNLGFSTELAAGNKEGFDDVLGRDHQTWFRNHLGLSYIKFDLPIRSDTSILRWTPAQSPFDLEIYLIFINFVDSRGKRVTTRLDWQKFSQLVSIAGMKVTKMGGVIGDGPGCAFYITHLRNIGLVGEGFLSLEIGCRFTSPAIHPIEVLSDLHIEVR